MFSKPKNFGINGLFGRTFGSGAGMAEISTLISTGGSTTVRAFLAGGEDMRDEISRLCFEELVLFLSGDESSSLDCTNSFETSFLVFVLPLGRPGPCFLTVGSLTIFSAFGGFGGLVEAVAFLVLLVVVVVLLVVDDFCFC